jgi:hypothetical protein
MMMATSRRLNDRRHLRAQVVGPVAPVERSAGAFRPSLQVGKEEAAKLLAAVGFKPVDDVALFPDKYFVIYRR